MNQGSRNGSRCLKTKFYLLRKNKIMKLKVMPIVKNKEN